VGVYIATNVTRDNVGNLALWFPPCWQMSVIVDHGSLHHVTATLHVMMCALHTTKKFRVQGLGFKKFCLGLLVAHPLAKVPAESAFFLSLGHIHKATLVPRTTTLGVCKHAARRWEDGDT